MIAEMVSTLKTGPSSRQLEAESTPQTNGCLQSVALITTATCAVLNTLPGIEEQRIPSPNSLTSTFGLKDCGQPDDSTTSNGNATMEFFKLLQSHPLNGIALVVALSVIVWCILLLRRVRGLYNRTLTGLVGMTAVFQGLRLLQGTGLLPENSRTGLDDAVNLLVTGIYLASLFALRGLSRESNTNALALRLAESNQAKPLQHPHVAPIAMRVMQTPADDLSRVVLDAAPIPMFAVGLDGNVNYWNRAAEQALGWSRDEVLGQKLPNLVLHPGDPFSMVDGPIRLIRKDGAPVDQSVRSVPIRDARGTLNGILTIVSA